MKAVIYLFSFLCSQDVSRSFVIEGQVLPFCQRCTGVYLGMGLSFIYLLVRGQYKRGLPPRSVLYINIAGLLLMPVFGFHLLDPGPGWRLWSGIIFGNAVAFLLAPAAAIIVKGGKAEGSYTRSSAGWFMVFLTFLYTIPLWFPIPSGCFYYVVLILTLIGLFGFLFWAGAGMVFLLKQMVALLILKGFSNGRSRCRKGLLS